MLAEELLKQGDLDGALHALQDAVKAAPADVSLRIFLFQLLATMGSWERALTQLNVAGGLDSQTYPMVQAYRETLRCEVLRERVFQGKRQPIVFGEPERWIALAFEALRLACTGNVDEARALRAEAYDAAPVSAGTIDGEPFEWIADGDDRIGPFLEAIVNGGYYWVPFNRVARVEIDAPADLRDNVWAPATLTWTNGGHAVGFVPSRYPGTAADTAPEFLLCRRSEWEPLAEDYYIGRGQKVFNTDANEYSLLDVRVIEFDVETVEGDGPGEDSAGA